MNCILALDTASGNMSVCLKKADAYFELSIDNGLKHSETLVNTIETVLAQAGISKSELELIVCSEGPGSFTGLRIGMSTAKGMAYGLGIPYTAVMTCDYMAAGFDYFDGLVIPVLDARKKRFYCGFYLSGKRLHGPLDLSEEEILSMASSHNKVLFTGADAHMIQSNSDNGIYIDGNCCSSRGRQLLTLGLERFNREGRFADDAGPLYIRKSEAEISLYGDDREKGQ